jgi:protease-4
MIAFALRLLYNLTVYPAALLVWWLQRRSLLRRSRAVSLHLSHMPQVASGRRLFRRISLAELSTDLDSAAADPLVEGLFASIDAPGASAADFHELAVLLDRFKRSGKRLHAFVHRADWHGLMAGRSADRLTTDPSSPVMVHGVGVEMPFVGELLERHGVEIQVRQRSEYKGVMEPFARRGPSPALLESMQAVVDSLFERAAEELARRPAADVARARAALEEGPYTAAQATARALVDAAVAEEDAEDSLATACGAGGATMPARESRRRTPPQRGATPADRRTRLPALRRAGVVRPAPLALANRSQLAFVPIAGLILDRPMRGVGRRQAAATELVPRIRRLADARGVEAIVLVIDSRGGTVTASDKVWSAARDALTKKPVLAWMRGYAASGGYYVAAAAEHIVASPFTITGSIGVIASKPNIAEAAAKAGIHPVAITRGGGATLFSPFRPFSDAELAWLEAYVDEAYERFKAIVAEGRRMPVAAVEQIARGRVWTGPQAHAHGLVDRIGTFTDVVAAARELAGIPAGRSHEVVWSAPREGLWNVARRFAAPAVDILPPAFDPLIDLYLLSREPSALYYMPLMDRW